MDKTTKKKSLIALTAIIVLSFLVAMPVSASGTIYRWEQVNDEGFDDFTNSFAWSMHEYKGYLYVGLLNANISDLAKVSTFHDIASIFPYIESDGLEIYRSETGDYNSWEQVVGKNGTQFIIRNNSIEPAKAGFSSFNIGANVMEEYSDLLWVGTANPNNGSEIWVTNGTHWKRANIPGFGKKHPSSARELTVFKDKIYAGVWDLRNTTDAYAEIWRYNGSTTNFDSVDPNAWEQVVDEGFGEPEHNKGIGGFAVFDPPDDGVDVEYLYAGTLALPYEDDPQGCEVWRSSTGDLGAWEEVVGNASGCDIGRGFGNRNNNALMSSKVFGDYLYMGTQNWIDGAEIWRTRDGTTWEPVTQNGFCGIKGPITIDDKEINISNVYMWRMHEYNGKLFVGTAQCGLGCQIWMSPSGNPGTFKQVNRNGMDGDMLQWGARSFETFKDKLYVGTASYPFPLSRKAGCEIWRTSGEPYLPPRIDVNKTVWDPEAHEWVDKLKASKGDTVRFRCVVHNNETSNLTYISVWDFSSRSLEYAGNATIHYSVYRGGTLVDREPNFTIPLTIKNQTIGTVLMWNFPFLMLAPSENITIEYDATVVRSGGIDINIQSATGYYKETGKWSFGCDYVIVVSDMPIIDVTKVVWNPEAHEWVDKLKASKGDAVRLRGVVHNNERSDLTKISVWDFLSRSLEYAKGSATVQYPSGKKVFREPNFVVPLTIKNQTIGTVLMWIFPFSRLEPSENITIEYDATVVRSSSIDINIQSATGYKETGKWCYGCDYVIVTESTRSSTGLNPSTTPIGINGSRVIRKR